MWNLESEKDNKRVYVNSTTGSKCITSKVYTDKEGNDWYLFDDLLTLPFTRNMATTKVVSLYQLGFSKDDLTSHINSLKTILKSSDAEKYEKAYAEVLDFESKANSATDGLKQLSSLVCVYFLLNDEPIDSFENSTQIKKLGLLTADAEMHNFFLSILIPFIENYMQRLAQLSQTALAQLPENPVLTQ